MGERRDVYKILVGKPEGKRPLGRPRCRWEDNIRMDLQEVGGGVMDWIEVVRDSDRWRTLVNTTKKFLCDKTKQMNQFHKYNFVMNLYIFRRVRLPIIRSLFTVHSAMVYVIEVCRQLSSRTRMELQFHPGPA